MKIEITRSFSKKIQLKVYEPVEFFCSAKQEVEEGDAELTSETLQRFCENEVAKTEALFERIKPESKFPDYKKDYKKIYHQDPKHKDVGQDSAEQEVREQFEPLKEEAENVPF